MSSTEFIQPLAVFNDAFSPLYRTGIGIEAITAYGEASTFSEDQLHPSIAKHMVSSLRRRLFDSRLMMFSRRFQRSGVRARIATAANGVPYVVIKSGVVVLVPCRFDEREFRSEKLPDHLLNLMKRSIAASRQLRLFDDAYEAGDHLFCLLGHGAETHKADRPSFLDVVIPDRYGSVVARMSLLPGRKKRRRPPKVQPKSEIDLPLKPEAKRRRDRRKGEDRA